MNAQLFAPTAAKPLLASVLVLVAQICPASALAEDTPPTDDVIATVNGAKIYRKEVETAAGYLRIQLASDEFASGNASDLDRSTKRKALGDLIDRELLVLEFDLLKPKVTIPDVDDAIKRLIEDQLQITKDDFLAELKTRGMTWGQFRHSHRRGLIVKAMGKHATQAVRAPTPEQKRAYLHEHESKFREGGTVHLKTLAIPCLTGDPDLTTDEQRTRQRELIADIRRKITAGSNFAELASSHSQDSKATQGGDWGTVDRGGLAPAFAKVAFSLPVGSISEVLEFRGSYYLLLVVERGDGQLMPQPQLDEVISKQLEDELRRKAIDDFLAKLRKKAKIIYADPSLRPE